MRGPFSASCLTSLNGARWWSRLIACQARVCEFCSLIDFTPSSCAAVLRGDFFCRWATLGIQADFNSLWRSTERCRQALPKDWKIVR
ncbi:hypothetical protein D3C71_2070370 [compost metagenome]